MNIIHYYAIRDKKSGFFHFPQPIQSDAEASRIFEYLRTNKTEDGKNLIAEFPEDYELYYVGGFDKDEGSFISSAPPRLVSASRSPELPAMPTTKKAFNPDAPIKRRKSTSIK